jgi:hypothetical protein
MVRPWLPALLAVAAVAIAGCASAPPPAADGTIAPSGSVAPITGPVQAGVPFAPAWTDTLHLRAAPHLNATAGGNDTVVATKGAYFPEVFVWNTTLAASGNLSGAHLVAWLLLPRSAVQQGVGGDPGCTLQWTIVATTNGSAVAADGGCVSLGFGPLAPGLYLLEGTAPPWAANLTVARGTDLAIQVQLGIVLPNGGAAYLISGAAHDSWLRLDGLRVPVPAG